MSLKNPHVIPEKGYFCFRAKTGKRCKFLELHVMTSATQFFWLYSTAFTEWSLHREKLSKHKDKTSLLINLYGISYLQLY